MPTDETITATMRGTHKTGMTPAAKYRFSDPHQRTLAKDPQGIDTCQGRIVTSWHYNPANSNAGSATELMVFDPTQLKGHHIGLVMEQSGQLIPFEGHVGGIAIIGNYLYTPNAPRGLHVFDLSTVYPVAGNQSALSSHAAFTKYDWIVPRVGHIAIGNTPGNAGLSWVSLSQDGLHFVVGNYYLPNSGYDAGGKTFIWRIPIDFEIDEFPAATPGVLSDQVEPTIRAGSEIGQTVTRVQGAAWTDTDVLILSCSQGSGVYQLLVYDLLHETEFFSGTAEFPKIHSTKNWLLGCEDLCFTSDGKIGTVTEIYDWRDVTFWDVPDVVDLMGTFLPPTIAEHQAALSALQQQLADLQAEVAFYEFQIASAISEGLMRFDRETYLV